MIEQEILYFLLTDYDLFIRYFKHIKLEFFHDRACNQVFKTIYDLNTLVKSRPSIDSVEIDIKSSYTNGYDKSKDETLKITEWMRTYQPDVDTLYKRQLIEKWIRQSAIKVAIYKSVDVIGSKVPDFNKVFALVKDAISINFDSDYGLNFFDIPSKTALYLQKDTKYPFLIAELNKVTNFGLEAGDAHFILAGMGVGKSRAMISLACDYIRQGFDVYYITMEMSAKSIMRRVDANMLCVDIKCVQELASDNDAFALRHYQHLDVEKTGRFVVKYVGYDTITMTDIRFCYEDLLRHTNIKPQIVFVDYLGMMEPSSGKDNMYIDGKYIAKEMKSFADEFKVVVISAAQLNTEGLKNAEPTLSNIAESRAIGHVASDVWALWDDPDNMNSRQFFKILKTRYSEYKNYKFPIGLVKNQFRMIDYVSEVDGVVKSKNMISGTNIKFNMERTNGH